MTDQTGKFDAANKGTLFLDELGELPLPAQAKLLRVLQDGIVETDRSDQRACGLMSGSLRPPIMISASRSVKGNFREDLYYRLNVGEIKLPSLRERRSDIPKLVLHILDRLNGSLKRQRPTHGRCTQSSSGPQAGKAT